MGQQFSVIRLPRIGKHIRAAVLYSKCSSGKRIQIDPCNRSAIRESGMAKRFLPKPVGREFQIGDTHSKTFGLSIRQLTTVVDFHGGGCNLKNI
jgi:hypothetical protein